jgi:hypothetical protein
MPYTIPVAPVIPTIILSLSIMDFIFRAASAREHYLSIPKTA